jgi:hypothetical protein
VAAAALPWASPSLREALASSSARRQRRRTLLSDDGELPAGAGVAAGDAGDAWRLADPREEEAALHITARASSEKPEDGDRRQGRSTAARWCSTAFWW